MSQYACTRNITMNDSVLLYDILDRIGLRTEVRRMYTRRDLTKEQINKFESETLGFVPNTQVLHVGSIVEGTTTEDLDSDIDDIHVFPCIVAQSHDSTGAHLECVISDQTKPGYIKLKLAKSASSSDIQSVLRDLETEIYLNGETFVTNVYKLTSIASKFSDCISQSKSGPAVKSQIILNQEVREIDYITAFNVNTWPPCAQEWIARKRHWPDKVTIGILTGLGHLVVPKGHPFSPEQRLEWKMSFSLQERHLMLSLNDVQYKCYVLMKLIKKSIIEPICGKCFTSYHCKTGLFYTIESEDTSIWMPHNLIQCLYLYMNRLYLWITNSFIPNYFIAADNLMDGKIENDNKIVLLQVLGEILRDPVKAIKQIDCDHVGKLFSPSSKDDYQVLIAEADTNIVELMRRLGQARIMSLLLSKRNILAFITTSPQGFLKNPLHHIPQIDITIHLHYHVLIHLKMYTKVAYLASDDSESVSLAPVATFIYTSLASNLVIKAMCLDNIIIRDWFLAASAICFHLGMDSDALSSRLKFATALYYMGHVDSCIKVLDEAELVIKDKQPGSLCACRTYGVELVIPESRIHTAVGEALKDCVCTCVTFTRTEMSMVHPALVCEMYRSVGTPEYSRDIIRCKWFDCAVMDSKLYLLFMRYFTNHTNHTMAAFYDFILRVLQGTDLEAFGHIYETRFKRYTEENAIINFLEQTKSEPVMMSTQYDRVAHEETLLNVIGWLYEHMGYYERAFVYYAESWKIGMDYGLVESMNTYAKKKNYHLHNAAKWHLTRLLYKLAIAANQSIKF